MTADIKLGEDNAFAVAKHKVFNRTSDFITVFIDFFTAIKKMNIVEECNKYLQFQGFMENF